MVHSDSEEEEVQVSIWPVCLDPYDSDCGVYSVLFHSSQYFRGNFLVRQRKSVSSILNRFSISFVVHLLRLFLMLKLLFGASLPSASSNCCVLFFGK